MFGKAGFNQINHTLGDHIWFELSRGRQCTGPRFAEAATVVSVVIPLAAGWFTIIHQNIESLTEWTVEELQPELLAAFRMSGKFIGRCEEVAVSANLQRQSRFGCSRFEHLADTPLARLDTNQ